MITRRTRRDRRMCLRCGFSGQRLQGDAGLALHRCPNCSEDLYTRPPRSYAELEGLVAPDAQLIPIAAPHRITISTVVRSALRAFTHATTLAFRRPTRPVDAAVPPRERVADPV